MKDHRCKISGFTLIELLIVVAIIAILAAIAVPNFLEAQVRSKVSRTKSDMRSMAVGLEAYRVDYNWYNPDIRRWNSPPPDGWGYPMETYPGWAPLTTPVAYLTSVPRNPFPSKTPEMNTPETTFRFYSDGWRDLMLSNPLGIANTVGKPTAAIWSLTSAGPDLRNSWGEWILFGYDALHYFAPPLANLVDPTLNSTAGALYDPTNGTISVGDIVRIGP